jgi:hypothetical protein
MKGLQVSSLVRDEFRLVRRKIKVAQVWHEGIAGFFFHVHAS